MMLNNLFFVIISISILCGNLFAVSPYAMTIQQNIQKKSFLAPISFPTTAADASFITKMQIKRDDYLPYFDRSAFITLDDEEIDELKSMMYRAEIARQEAFNNSTLQEYCEQYPEDAERCPLTGNESAFVAPPDNVFDNLFPTNQTGNSTDYYMSMALTPENIAAYNLKTYNGGCTPSDRSNWWRNYIQTSSRYERIDAPFEKFMATAFRKEGDCGQLANDPGGYTCFGCASNGLCNGVDMRRVTRGLVEDLAYRKMYKAYHVDRLPDAFRGYAMWGIWGSGPRTGIRLFQAALNIQQTGKIDNATISAAQNYQGDFGDIYTRVQEKFYRNLAASSPRHRNFLNGWLNSLPLLRTSGCHVVPTSPIYR